MLHAKLAPSSAARRVLCPGSRALEARYPETVESPSAREGHAAHWVAQQYLLCNYSLPAIAPNGEPITDEMLDGADLYEHEIKWAPKNATTGLHIEERTDISIVHADCWGTPDCWFIIDSHLHIFDYKFGHGFVEVFENWQLLEYAAGVAFAQEAVTKVTMTIIQPRCYTKEGPIRSWTINAAELLRYTETLRAAEARASEPEAICTPNPECKNCLGRHACTALQRTAGKFADLSSENLSYELDSRQTAWELKYLRHAAAMIDARMTGLEEQAKSMIMRGESVPGFKLESGQGREHWAKDKAEVVTLGEIMGLNLAKPQDVITPAQARKLGLPDDILASYSQRIPGKLKLIEDNSAAKVFRK